MTEPASVADYSAALQKEYGTYRATSAIFINGVRAFNPGNPVPASHIEPDDRHGIAEYVEKIEQGEPPAPSAPATYGSVAENDDDTEGA